MHACGWHPPFGPEVTLCQHASIQLATMVWASCASSGNLARCDRKMNLFGVEHHVRKPYARSVWFDGIKLRDPILLARQGKEAATHG